MEGINLVYVSQIRDAIGYIMKNRLSDYWLIYGLNKSIRLSSKIFCLRKSADREKEERIKSYGEWN